MKLRRNYELIEHPKVSYCQCVQIRRGKYKGLVLHYGRTAFVPLEDGKMKFQFAYTIVENPRNVPDDAEREKFLGDVLIDIIDHELKTPQGILSSPLTWNDVEPVSPTPDDPEDDVEIVT